ncbi:MAG: hypothetical protein QW812_03610 [Thermoplasmataceae archaeon]
MYISAPPGIKYLAKFLLLKDEFQKLDEVDFNIYGEERSLAILQFMRDLKWIFISYDDGDKISLKPTDLGLDIFENGISEEYVRENEPFLSLVRSYLKEVVSGKKPDPSTIISLEEYYIKTGNHTRAADFASLLIQIGSKENDPRVVGLGHYYYGTSNLYKMELEFAFPHFQKAISYLERADDIKHVALSFLGLGSYYGYVGSLDKAMEAFERSLLLFREISDEAGVNLVRMNEAYAMVFNGNIREFFEMNKVAANFFLNSNDLYHLQFCYQNEASVLLYLGQYNLAIDSVVEAHELAKKTKSERMIHLSGLNIASIYIWTRRPGDGYSYIDEAYEYFRRNLDNNGLGECYVRYMLYHIATKNLKEADKALEKAERNLMAKKRLKPILEVHKNYVDLMQLYEYPSDIIKMKTEEIKERGRKLGIVS